MSNQLAIDFSDIPYAERPEYHTRIQSMLFSTGAVWASGSTIVRYVHAVCLIVTLLPDGGMRITWSSDAYHFEDIVNARFLDTL